MRRLITYGGWIALFMCVSVLAATLDNIPDPPATARSYKLRAHTTAIALSNSAVNAQRPLLSGKRPPLRRARHEQPSFTRRPDATAALTRDASDSSPPPAIFN